MYEEAQETMTQNAKFMENFHSHWEKTHLKDQENHRKHILKWDTKMDM